MIRDIKFYNKMKRLEFFKKIGFNIDIDNESFVDEDFFQLKEKEAELYYQKKLDIKDSEYFNNIIKQVESLMNVKIEKEDLLLFNIDVEQDYYEMSDYERLVYNCEYNINELYDMGIKKQNNKNTVKVYRLENEKGEGIYSANGIKIKTNCEYKNPDPVSDGDISVVFCKSKKYQSRNDYCKKWYFGFKNKEQIYNWFPEEDIIELSNKNIKIVEYEVSKDFLIESEVQLIFKKEESLKKNSINLEFKNNRNRKRLLN